MRKTLWACVAASALSLAFTATSFAAVTYGEDSAASNDLISYNETDNTITIKGDLTACGEDATVLVLKPLTTASITDDDILYITQEKVADQATKLANLGLKGTSLEKGIDYTVKIGGTNITDTSAIKVATFKITDNTTPDRTPITFHWGDITKDDNVDLSDAIAALSYDVEGGDPQPNGTPYTINQQVTLYDADGKEVTFHWGDITKDNNVDLSDAIAALSYDVEGGDPQPNGTPYRINESVTLYK